MNKLVSVIMPVFNAEKYLKRSIESILCQDFIDFEFIIINDGSLDHSEEIIKSYLDPRIVYLKNEINQGIVYSLNKGLKAAKSKYIARMDADDISLPHRLQKQVDFLEQHPEIGVLGTAYLPVDENQVPVKQPVVMPEYPMTAKWFLLIGSAVAHPTTMYRNELINRVGGYSDQFPHAEDYELWTRVCQISKIGSLKDICLLYRDTDSNSISKKYIVEQTITTNNIRKLAFSRLFEKEITSSISNCIQRLDGINSSRDYYQACLLLHDIYNSMELKNTYSSALEKQELTQTVNKHLLIVASRINNPIFVIKILFTRLFVSRIQFINLLLQTNKYRLLQQLRKN